MEVVIFFTNNDNFISFFGILMPLIFFILFLPFRICGTLLNCWCFYGEYLYSLHNIIACILNIGCPGFYSLQVYLDVPTLFILYMLLLSPDEWTETQKVISQVHQLVSNWPGTWTQTFCFFLSWGRATSSRDKSLLIRCACQVLALHVTNLGFNPWHQVCSSKFC